MIYIDWLKNVLRAVRSILLNLFPLPSSTLFIRNRIQKNTQKRMDDNKLLETIETRVREHVDVKRVWCDVVRKGVSSARLLRAPNDYYDWKLSQRALFLNCSIPQLTKSIIVENVAYSKRDCSDPLNSRYYCIIIQYIAKLNSEKLLREVRKFCSEGKEICLSKKYFNFQHAPYVRLDFVK